MPTLTFENDTFEYRKEDFEHQENFLAQRDAENYVTRAFYKPLERYVVVKHSTISYRNLSQESIRKRQNEIENEINNFRLVSECEHIVNFYGYDIFNPSFKDQKVTIIMESMDFNLRDFYLEVHRKGIMFPEDILGIIAARMIDALDFCKSKNIMHRDVKPGNILVNKTESLATSRVGMMAYWPPEHFDVLVTEERPSYDVRADVWSLGVTFLEIAYGRIPYFNENERQPNLSDFIIARDIITSSNREDLVQKVLNGKYSAHAILFAGTCLEVYGRRSKICDLKSCRIYMDNASKPKERISEFIKDVEESQ